MMIFNKMSFLSMIGVLLALVKCSEAMSEQSAIIVLGIFITIPALFLLTCCCTLIFVCHYRHKIPIFKTFMANARKGTGTGKTATSSAAPPPHAPGNPMPPPTYGATTPVAPPAANPSAPPGEQKPGTYEMEKPVEVDDVVVPIKKE